MSVPIDVAVPFSNKYMTYLHRVVFWALLLLALGWCLYALRANLFKMLVNFEFFGALKTLYIIGFTASFWPLVYMETVEYIYSRMGKNGRQSLEYAKSLQKDLVVTTLTALALACIYWLDSASYGLSGIDIAFVGFPLLISSLYTMIQCTKVKIAGKYVRRGAIAFNFFKTLAFTSVAFWLLIKNSSGELKTDQALYLQISVLLIGLHFFLTNNLVYLMFKQGRVEPSAFRHYFVHHVIRSKHGLYNMMEAEMAPLNRRLQAEKAKHAQEVRKRQKKNPR
ncbi:hypothetical protein [Pseudomonas folii]|uniref:Transporter n=1 Tax=Pseudomonas folii TaxID=2762593 RepID=A0ABR7AW98_9PSED|nr:hypothetical protein [Pseudomonas folii]MBC3949010.1 hypothetical protein [Pseudomonas folii]